MSAPVSTRCILIPILLLVAIACAPVVRATAYKTLPAKASPDDVAIFTDSRPERPYEELGMIEVKSLGLLPGATDNGKLIVEARTRAAQMGADAIIVSLRPVERSTTVGGATARRKGKGVDYHETTSTSERPRISVVAIVWKPER